MNWTIHRGIEVNYDYSLFAKRLINHIAKRNTGYYIEIEY